MGQKLNSKTPIEDLHQVIADFHQKYPGALDDAANVYIVKLENFRDRNIGWLAVFLIFCFLVFFPYRDENGVLFSLIVLLGAGYIVFMAGRLLLLQLKDARALARRMAAAGVDGDDLRDLRLAYRLIREKRSHGRRRGSSSGGGGSTSSIGCGGTGRSDGDGSSGCGSGCGGGGGGCGGGGGD